MVQLPLEFMQMQLNAMCCVWLLMMAGAWLSMHLAQNQFFAEKDLLIVVHACA